VRGYRDRDWHATLKLVQQPAELELIRQIESDSGFVEQQDARTFGGGDLCESGGDNHALFLAAAERVEGAICERKRSGGRERLARDREVLGSLNLERS
jgi:hypothetical protein